MVHFSALASVRTNKNHGIAQKSESSAFSKIPQISCKESSPGLLGLPKVPDDAHLKGTDSDAIQHDMGLGDNVWHCTNHSYKHQNGQSILAGTLRTTHRGVGRTSHKSSTHNHKNEETWIPGLSWKTSTEKVSELVNGIFCLRRQVHPGYPPIIATMEKHGYRFNEYSDNRTYSKQCEKSSPQEVDTSLNSAQHKIKRLTGNSEVSRSYSSQSSQENEISVLFDQEYSEQIDHAHEPSSSSAHVMEYIYEGPSKMPEDKPNMLYAFKDPVITTGIEPKRVFSALLRNIEKTSKRTGKTQVQNIHDHDIDDREYNRGQRMEDVGLSSTTRNHLIIEEQEVSPDNLVSFDGGIEVDEDHAAKDIDRGIYYTDAAEENVGPSSLTLLYERPSPPSYTQLPSKSNSLRKQSRNSSMIPMTISGRPPRFPKFEQSRAVTKAIKEDSCQLTPTMDIAHGESCKLAHETLRPGCLEQTSTNIQHKRHLTILEQSQQHVSSQIHHMKISKADKQLVKHTNILRSTESGNVCEAGESVFAEGGLFQSKTKPRKFSENSRPMSSFVLNGEGDGSAFI